MINHELPVSILTTCFWVNGRVLTLDTAKIPSRLGGYDFETMLLDENGESYDEAHARNHDDALANHYAMHQKYNKLFGSEYNFAPEDKEV